MAGGSGERTEQATPKRRKDERKKGNVFMSQEIITLASLLAVFYTLSFVGPFVISALRSTFENFWGMAAYQTVISESIVRRLFLQGALAYAVAALPTLLVAGLVAVIFTFAQTRGLVSGAKIKPDFKKLSPAKGIKKVFSIRGLVELLKSILKITVLIYVVYGVYMDHFEELPRLMEMDYLKVLAYGGAFIMDIVTSVSLAFAFLAAADFLYQRWQFEKDLRMTKQEIKEEYKQTEGDPQVKGQIRQRQRQMSMGRMMQSVPEADVIIKNPTHYAVAIKYVSGKNAAPMVLAKGADLVALRIIKVAEESGVTVMENKPLARGLYENVPLDMEIPEEFFGAVAEVLAVVYSTNKKYKGVLH